ncbi:hypothetical protein DTO063F5_9158 [Paecilomyces variotii]|nr:hypothetical protein DTO063F5_9158 [Paecilomyces variotii]
MSPAEESASSASRPTANPIVRNALRVTLSAKEYKLLHEQLIKRSPSLVRSYLPTPSRFEEIVSSKEKYNEAAIRASVRVFLATGTGLKLVDLILQKIRGETAKSKSRVAFIHSPKFRLSLALSLVLFLHRILHRFFTRLRANLRTEDARPFRERNPRVSKALTSRYAPAIGASLAGFALGVYPESQLRISVALYTATKSLEFLYNLLEDKGYFAHRPSWFGSWLLMPLSGAQLFHAFIYDRETIPKWFGDAILRFSPGYMHQPPSSLLADHQWPSDYELVDSLGKIAKLRWPPFISPILHPGDLNTLPSAVESISPITSPAHPLISSLSCALMHPSTPSCSTAFLHQVLLSVPRLGRLLTAVVVALSAAKYKNLLAQPFSSANALSKQIITMTAVLSAALSSAWGSICFLNFFLPRSFLPTKRFFLSGAIGGLPFAFVANGRSNFLYIFRAALYSAWKSGVKRGLWRGWKGGELWLIVLAWALLGSVLERKPAAVDSRGIRKGLAWLKGDGFADPVEVAAKRKARRASLQKRPDTRS